jgi:hypothetical protein
VGDLERMIVVIGIAMVVLAVGLSLLLLLLQRAPKAMQQRVYDATARWNETMFGFLGRASYAYAVLMVVTIGLALIAAVALLFVPSN